MPLTLNIDPPHVVAIKQHAKKTGMSASRLVTHFIDELTTDKPPPSLGITIKMLRNNRDALTDKGLIPLPDRTLKLVRTRGEELSELDM